jgi:hypothetical protein
VPREVELQILASIADTIGRSHHMLPSGEITGFMAMVGQTYQRDLMVVGRAVNGWRAECTPEALTIQANLQQFVQDVLDNVTDQASCPMRWVSTAWGNTQYYNTRRSAFWRAIRRVVGALNIADIEDAAWPSYLIWSNLYKIAPAAGGNPSAMLCSLQLNGCISLLEEEFQTYRPKRLLFLTGIGWAGPFVKRLAPSLTVVPDFRYVQAVGKTLENNHDASTIVVAVHPQGKLEGSWVQEVVEAFQS